MGWRSGASLLLHPKHSFFLRYWYITRILGGWERGSFASLPNTAQDLVIYKDVLIVLPDLTVGFHRFLK